MIVGTLGQLPTTNLNMELTPDMFGERVPKYVLISGECKNAFDLHVHYRLEY